VPAWHCKTFADVAMRDAIGGRPDMPEVWQIVQSETRFDKYCRGFLRRAAYTKGKSRAPGAWFRYAV
jgi:hypothetical protein